MVFLLSNYLLDVEFGFLVRLLVAVVSGAAVALLLLRSRPLLAGFVLGSVGQAFALVELHVRSFLLESGRAASIGRQRPLIGWLVLLGDAELLPLLLLLGHGRRRCRR